MSRIAMNSLWRTLSGASSKEIHHQHPHTLRPTPSLDIESRTGHENDGLRPCASLPAHLSLDSPGSLAESLSSSSPNSSTLGCESPTAGPRAGKRLVNSRASFLSAVTSRDPIKAGVDPYDYWSLIKSL